MRSDAASGRGAALAGDYTADNIGTSQLLQLAVPLLLRVLTQQLSLLLCHFPLYRVTSGPCWLVAFFVSPQAHGILRLPFLFWVLACLLVVVQPVRPARTSVWASRLCPRLPLLGVATDISHGYAPRSSLAAASAVLAVAATSILKRSPTASFAASVPASGNISAASLATGAASAQSSCGIPPPDSAADFRTRTACVCAARWCGAAYLSPSQYRRADLLAFSSPPSRSTPLCQCPIASATPRSMICSTAPLPCGPYSPAEWSQQKDLSSNCRCTPSIMFPYMHEGTLRYGVRAYPTSPLLAFVLTNGHSAEFHAAPTAASAAVRSMNVSLPAVSAHALPALLRQRAVAGVSLLLPLGPPLGSAAPASGGRRSTCVPSESTAASAAQTEATAGYCSCNASCSSLSKRLSSPSLRHVSFPTTICIASAAASVRSAPSAVHLSNVAAVAADTLHATQLLLWSTPGLPAVAVPDSAAGVPSPSSAGAVRAPRCTVGATAAPAPPRGSTGVGKGDGVPRRHCTPAAGGASEASHINGRPAPGPTGECLSARPTTLALNEEAAFVAVDGGVAAAALSVAVPSASGVPATEGAAAAAAPARAASGATPPTGRILFERQGTAMNWLPRETPDATRDRCTTTSTSTAPTSVNDAPAVHCLAACRGAYCAAGTSAAAWCSDGVELSMRHVAPAAAPGAARPATTARTTAAVTPAAQGLTRSSAAAKAASVWSLAAAGTQAAENSAVAAAGECSTEAAAASVEECSAEPTTAAAGRSAGGESTAALGRGRAAEGPAAVAAAADDGRGLALDSREDWNAQGAAGCGAATPLPGASEQQTAASLATSLGAGFPVTVLRFAPSPSGPLHVGGARTALFNYLLVEKMKQAWKQTQQHNHLQACEKQKVQQRQQLRDQQQHVVKTHLGKIQAQALLRGQVEQQQQPGRPQRKTLQQQPRGRQQETLQQMRGRWLQEMPQQGHVHTQLDANRQLLQHQSERLEDYTSSEPFAQGRQIFHHPAFRSDDATVFTAREETHHPGEQVDVAAASEASPTEGKLAPREEDLRNSSSHLHEDLVQQRTSVASDDRRIQPCSVADDVHQQVLQRQQCVSEANTENAVMQPQRSASAGADQEVTQQQEASATSVDEEKLQQRRVSVGGFDEAGLQQDGSPAVSVGQEALQGHRGFAGNVEGVVQRWMCQRTPHQEPVFILRIEDSDPRQVEGREERVAALLRDLRYTGEALQRPFYRCCCG